MGAKRGTSYVRLNPGRKRWEMRLRYGPGDWRWVATGKTDRRSAEALRDTEQARIDRGDVGLLDPFDATRRKPLTKLVEAYVESLQARNRADRYVAGVRDRLDLVLDATGARHLQDLEAATVDSFLARLLRGDADLPPMKARSDRGEPIPRGPISMRTRDRYVETLRAFGAWLHDSERWGSNPFARLRKEARESDRTMEHRALDVDELERLVAAAEVRGPQEWARSHPGADRAKLAELEHEGWSRGALYLFAAFTGLRANECRTLRWRDLVLDGDQAHVVVQAVNAKNRTEERVPLLPHVVERLRELRRRQKAVALRAGEPVPGGAAAVFQLRRGLMRSLRKDAKWAGLGLNDEAGRTLTFHGFRASTATLLARAGVSQPIAMRVLRHKDANLTARVYAKLDLSDMHRELRAKIPTTPVTTNSAPMRAAAGCSGPLGESGSAIADRQETRLQTGLRPLESATSRSGEREGKWWALQESNL